MTNAQSPQALPIAVPLAAELTEEETKGSGPVENGPTVGASDAEADAARSGGDADLADPTRDSDGTPVGEADLEADRRRSAP
jgi:hypothetical protein